MNQQSMSETVHPQLQTRQDLAACYRLMDHFAMTDLISTHLSARLPDTETILINRYGLLFNEITASNLLAISIAGAEADDTNPAGHLIHTAIHSGRPDVACVIHTHTAAGVAVSCQKNGLLPISQHALQFYNRIGYHNYEPSADYEAEKRALVRDLSSHNALILRNHGLLTVGRTIAEAFILMFNLERACQIQVRALAGNPELSTIHENLCAWVAEQFQTFGNMAVGEAEWGALMRLVRKIAPDFAS